MLDTINVGIPIVGSKGWLGGISYIELLVKAVTSLPQDSRPKLFLIVTEESLPDLPLHEAILPLFNGIIFVGNYQGELPNGIIRIESYPALFKALDFYYPVLSDVWPGARAASWIPDFQHMYLPRFFSDDDIKMRSNAFARIAAQAQLVVFSSNDALRDFHRFFPRSEAITRVLPFYALPQENWYADDFLETQQRYGLPDLFVICCNQIWTHKNHQCLFEAIAALHDQRIDLHLVCTGSTTDYRNPEYFPRLKDLIRALGIEHLVHIVGNIPRMDQIQLIRRSMAVVQPSLFEGWSTVVEDCRALGKTMLLSDLQVHREQAPRHGVYFDRTSSASLAQVIREMMPEFRPGPDAVREHQARDEAYTLVDAFGRRFCAIVQESLHLPFGTRSPATPLPRSPSAFPESALAHKWLDGLTGLEIGSSAHNPFGLATRNVGLVFEGYIKEQRELTGEADVIHIVAPADDIPVPDDSEDFVLSSHVIEHCPDMIRALIEWYRVIKPGGYLYMIIPFRDAAPTDKGRPLTEWSHLFADYVNRITEKEEPEANGIPFGYGHYHVFEINNLHSFVQKTFGARLELVDHQNQDDKIGNGFTLVYRKQKSFANSFPWNLSDGGLHFEIRRPIAGEQPAIPTDRIVVAANLVPFRDPATRQRQDACIASIDALSGKGVVPLNICFPDELLEPAGWQLAPVLQQSADVKLGIEGKRKPFVTDLFDSAAAWASEQGIGWFVLTNSDIILTERLLTAVRACLSNGCETIAISRNEVERIDPERGLIPGYLEINGYDVFVCRTDWWRQNRSRFQPYIFGERAWDDAYAAIMACHSRFIMLYEDGLCFHFKHSTEWISGLYADYNMGVYTGIDKQYSDRYEAFVKEVIGTDKVLLGQKVYDLLNKYFTFPSAAETVKNAPRPDAAFVNVGMVTYNRLEFTRQAIAALVTHSDYPHALTVIDNNSQDGSKEYLLDLKEQGVIKNLVLLDENVGVAKAANLAWSLEPEADYFLKLDNDIVIQKSGWLSAMIRVIDNIPEVWALGYNFEPKSYPPYEVNGHRIRPKSGNIGGACFLVPRRAHEKLGFWCEDYGLYGEEDFDYGTRISLCGMYNAYMADEDIGMHLPAGRAASIDENTYCATDGVEESHHAEYRLFKDEQRRGNMWGGRVGHNVAGYQNKTLSLYQPSIFAEKWLAQNATDSGKEVIAATASFPDVALPKEPVIKVVILSLDGPDSACARIRLRAPMDYLRETLSYAWAVSVIGQECSTDLDMIDGADLIVVQRFYPRNGTAPILERALNSGKPVIYEADDFLFELPDTNHLKPWAGETAELLEKLLPRFSAITVSTPQLKEEFSHFQANVFVLPNMVEDGLFRNVSHRNGTKITIGYCGTNTHARDLELIDDAVFHIAQNYGDKVEFVFMGYAGKHHAKLPGFRYVDFELDYQSYAQKLAGLNIDIALIPIEDNRFNRCKSNIKWLEYSACGYAGIYADLAPYNTTIEHGRTGLLVGASSQQWYKAVSMLIENDYLRRFIAANARTEVLSRYSLSANAHKWLDAYRAIVLNHTVAEPASQVKVSIIVLAWNRPGMLDQCLAEITSKIHFSDSYELIVGDNGSAVDAQEVLAKYKIHKLIRRETNEGLELYKDLYAVAAGDLIIEIDDDVIELPLHFDLQMARYLDEFPDYGLIGLDVVQNEHSNGAKPDGRYYESEYRNGLEIEQGPVVGCCMAVRRSLFNSFGGFSGEALSLTRSQDWVLADRVHGAGLKTGIISGIKCLHACGPYYASLYGDISQDVRKYRNSGLHELADNYDSYAVKRSSTEKHAPPASIIIPVFNKVEYSRECIKALTANTCEELYELILVDNGSTDATGSFFETLPKTVKIIKNDTNQGFAKACNQGARAARSNFLLFLNNDTEPQAGWLEALLHAAEQDSNIAAAGSKLLFPDGTIQHAGVIIADDRVTPDPLVGKHIYYGFPADHAAANTSRVYQALTAACLLVRRDAFEAVQGFDEGYWNGYEDVDLCFKLGQKGWTLIYQPASVIVHHESKSGSERFAKAAQNIQRLHEKWLGTIQPDLIIHPDAKEQWQGRAASAATTAEPLVSIVIPLSNQAAFTRNA